MNETERKALIGAIKPISVDFVMQVRSPKGRREVFRNRPCYGISFCTEGSLTYTHEGVAYTSTPEYAILLPEGATYLLEGKEAGVFPLVNFKCHGTPFTRHTLIPIASVAPYLADFERLRALSVGEDNEQEKLSVLYHILWRLSREGDGSLLSPAVHEIEKRFTDPTLTNDALAALCHVSEVYFRRLFAARFGTSPKQYILKLRLNLAKQMLSEGAYQIGAIAEACGFGSPYHFCRTFHAAVGMTPSEYAKENRVLHI